MVRFRIIDAALIGAMAMLFAACGEGAPEDALAAAGDDPAARAAAVLSLPSRPVEDHGDDALRKPANVLAYMDIRPGMKIFEVEGGAGYYTQLFSPLVGPKGEVVMHNPEPFDAFLGDVVTTRVAGLDNVRVTKSTFDNLDADDGSMDIVTWLLGPHDLYYTPGGAALGDDKGAFAEIMRILKPGGFFFVLDHAATPGSPKSAGNSVHRIDPALVLEMVTEAGFMLAGESDVLRNPDDNYDMNIFEPEVRRKTDRFFYKFKKPE